MADQVQSKTSAGRGTAPVSAPGGGSPFRILKPGQGKWVRWCTVAGVGTLAVAGAAFLSEQIQIFRFAENEYVRALVPVVFLLVIAYLTYWMLGRKDSVVNFMIATEGEMKKVNWSTRREVWGATRVVIVTVIALAFLLFVVDVLFMTIFSGIGVLRINVFEKFFGSGSV